VFLVIGCLFAWTVVGADPTPEPAPALIRLGLLLVAMPFDVVVVLRRRPGAPDRDYEALTEMLDSQLQSQQRQKGLPAGSA
jgi:cytochrome c oxidase assembly factor CtaG